MNLRFVWDWSRNLPNGRRLRFCRLLLWGPVLVPASWASQGFAQVTSNPSVPVPATNIGPNTTPANVGAPEAVTTPPAAAVSLPASPASSLDPVYRLKGFNIPFPSFGDTLSQDAGGWRTTLARNGFGFLLYDLNISAINLLDTPRSNNGRQAYWGQKPSNGNYIFPWLTYDLSQYGIPDGQIAVAAIITTSTWQAYFPSTAAIGRLSYYQTLFNKKLEVNFGYMSNSSTFVGTYVGGNLQSPFGPSASIPVELGLTAPPSVQPTIWAKYHFLGFFYDQPGVARSNSPVAGSGLRDRLVNPSQLDFQQPGSGGVFVNEFGYQRPATPSAPQMWIRLGGIYNNSEYQNYQTGSKSHNHGFYLLADRQIWQTDKSSALTAGRGVYIGAEGPSA